MGKPCKDWEWSGKPREGWGNLGKYKNTGERMTMCHTWRTILLTKDNVKMIQVMDDYTTDIMGI